MLIFNKYHSASDGFTRHIRSLHIVIGILALLCGALIFSLSQSAQKMRLSLPPRLEYGAEIVSGNIQEHEIYMFAGYVHQQLNIWREDGRQDASHNIQRLRYFFLPDAVDYFVQRFNKLDRQGELAKRTRYILPAESYKPQLVQALSHRKWIVTLRYYLHEQIDSMKLKDSVLLEVQLPVEYINKDPEYNLWGLWIGVPLNAPQRLKKAL